MSKVIGIDPGKHTGVCIAMNGKIVKLFDCDFWGAIDCMDMYSKAIVVVELPSNRHVWHNGAESKSAIQRTGVNVGSCIREAELLISWLHRNNRNYVIQRPQGKINAEKFKRITGWVGRTNQHMRDAGMLCFSFKK